MDIIKRLKLSNGGEAVLLKDGDMEYPVFMDSLLNTVICDELLASGWQLCGLPYDFRKDGVKLSEIPVEDINLTVDEEQEMWDLLGDKLSNEDLISRITEAAVEYLPTPEADYTIHTREEFLKYLDSIESVTNDSDFLPINYFVHPTAIFTYDELLSGTYRRYFEIMERRRKMSYTKFTMLLNWCFSKGLPRAFKPMDFLDFYYQWGIDGLYLPLINKKRNIIYRAVGSTSVSLDMADRQYIQKHEIGLVDNTGTILVPTRSQNIKWRPNFPSEQMFNEVYRSLRMDETKVVDLTCRTTGEETVMEGLHGTIQYDTGIILTGNIRMSNFFVYGRDISGKPISPDMWNPDSYEDMHTTCYLRALAQEAIEKCIIPCTATSFKALTLNGCTPYSALMYYIVNQHLDKSNEETVGAEGNPVLSFNDIDDYIAGTLTSGEKYDALNNFIIGVSNIDSTYTGIEAEAQFSTDNMYKEMYVLHHILGISLSALHEKITNIGDDEYIDFTGNGYTHRLELPKIRLRVKGYNEDLKKYREDAAHDAIEYVYVTKIARESGSLEAKRHIALECYVLFKTPSAKIIIEELRKKINDKIESNVVGLQQQAIYKNSSLRSAIAAFFEVALHGTITYPSVLGGEVEHVDNNMRVMCFNQLTSRVDSTVMYCNTNVTEAGTFRRFCVNAYVTPEYVIPRGSNVIPESSFIALWRDFSSAPATRAKLIEKGLIPENHIPWENRYYNDSLCMVDFMSNDNLMYYDEQANDYRLNLPENVEFIAVPHMLEYLTPGIYQQDDDSVRVSDVPLRTGAPNFALGEAYERRMSDFDAITSIDGVTGGAVGFKPFLGYDANDFYLVDNVLNTDYNAPIENSIVVFEPDKFYTKETGTVDYTALERLDSSRFPVRNIRGRKYVLRDVKGKLWEVEI